MRRLQKYATIAMVGFLSAFSALAPVKAENESDQSSDSEITLNYETVETATRETIQLYAYDDTGSVLHDVSWSSSDEEIATVDGNGLVKALRYGKVTITAAAAANPAKTATCEIQTRFYDVNDDSKYYYIPVYWAADNNVTKGYDRVYFGPQRTCTRRELAIFLWRISGRPDVSGTMPFSDMGAYAETTDSYKAVLWASENGIVRGYSDGTFGPNKSIIRKDTMIMLYRLAGRPDVSGTLEFDDVKALGYGPDTDTYKSVIWGTENVITKGYADGTFKPLADCLREHIVTFIYRYDKLMNPEEDDGIYDVKFVTNGGSSIAEQAVYAGECAIEPEAPTKEGYVFDGWYKDIGLTEPYDFTLPVNGDITLYAAWKEANVTIHLALNTQDITENERTINGSVNSNLAIEKVEYVFESDNNNVSGEIELNEDNTFEITVLLEGGNNIFTVSVTTVDGSVTEKSIEMTYESGEIIDYGNIDDVYDPDDPRVVTKPVDDPEDTTKTFVINILNVFFTEDSTAEERAAFIETGLNGSVAGALNTVDMMQAWLPETLVEIEGYEGTLILADITEAELNVYAEAVIEAYDIVEDAYIDYLYKDVFEMTTNDPWSGTLDANHDDPGTAATNDWWIKYVNFPDAWNYNSYYNSDFLSDITLGIVDSGFNDTHEELSSVRIISKEDTPHYHGTHVAGIVAARANNSVGLAGGTYNNASVVAYDGTSDRYFSDTEIYAGLTKTVEAGAKVINFSLGSAGKFSNPDYKTASQIESEGKTSSRYIGKLLQKNYDFIVVKSAGNAGIDSINNGSFACINISNCASVAGVEKQDIVDRVLIVSAIGNSGQLASFSCGGTSGTNAIAAPGVDIFSCGINDHTYAYLSGTSMAAPIVTAGAGLVWSVNEALSGAQVVDLVMNNTNGAATYNSSSHGTAGGMGILDVNAAVEAAVETLGSNYGYVVDAVTGEPIEGAKVVIHRGRTDGPIVGSEGSYITDSDGRFDLPKLPIKVTYYFEFTAEGYVPLESNYRVLASTITSGSAISLGRFGMTPILNEDEYRIILRWTGEPSDLDSHLVATTTDGSKYHVAYYDKDPSPYYANLDLDDTDYEGPETVTITGFNALRNIKYAVHDYTNRDSSSSTVLSNSGAYIEVYKGSSLIRTFNVPRNTGGTEWDVFGFDANGEIVPINQMKYCSNPENVLASSSDITTNSSRYEK